MTIDENEEMLFLADVGKWWNGVLYLHGSDEVIDNRTIRQVENILKNGYAALVHCSPISVVRHHRRVELAITPEGRRRLDELMVKRHRLLSNENVLHG